jgi:hypothetical protein
LTNGDEYHEYNSRSEVIMAIVNGAVAKGWFPDQIFVALTDKRNLGGQKLLEIARQKGYQAARHYLLRCFNKASAYCGSDYSTSSSEEIRRIRHGVHAQFAWSGRAGHTDRAVLLAH